MSAEAWDDELDVDLSEAPVDPARAEALLEVVSLVLEARCAAQIGQAGRSDRAVIAAAGALTELLP